MTRTLNSENLTQRGEIFIPRLLDIQEIWLEHERAHWNIDEIDMRTDLEQWKTGKISDSEKAHIKMILRLFTQSDDDVCCAYADRLIPIFKQSDARNMLLSFAARETTHTLGYRHLNTTLGYDTEAFASEFLSYKELVAKHDFIIEAADLSTPAGIALYLGKQCLIEGTNLFAAFIQLLAFRLGGKIPGTVDVNIWSIADETIHVRGNTSLFHKYLEQHPEVVTDEFKTTLYTTYTRLIEVEDASIDLTYSVGDNPYVSQEDCKKYIRYIGDYRMMNLGFKPQYNITENPCPWVDQITGTEVVGNFFERTVTAYAKGNLKGTWVY
jgi:ribonucleoside-diphosphate reductase beta chain